MGCVNGIEFTTCGGREGFNDDWRGVKGIRGLSPVLSGVHNDSSFPDREQWGRIVFGFDRTGVVTECEKDGFV